MLFLDTPGIHKPQHKLGEYMVHVAVETIEDADVVLWLVDVNVSPTAEDRSIADLLSDLYLRRHLHAPIVLGLNKLDAQPSGQSVLTQRVADYAALLDSFAHGTCGGDKATSQAAAPLYQPVAFSALTGQGIDDLPVALRRFLPQGPRYYPADQVTDLQTRFIVAELIREQALRLLQQEVPHSIAVVVDEFVPRSEELTYISAVVYVERDSQKGIVLGQRGHMIKRIGQAARPEIEELVGTRVYLELWVKVWEKWRKREGMLRRLRLRHAIAAAHSMT